MTRRRSAILAVLGIVALLGAACGKYGPPTRRSGAPATSAESETFEEDEKRGPEELP